jgi:WhiB family redox-sensing transcriptional regulator
MARVDQPEWAERSLVVGSALFVPSKRPLSGLYPPHLPAGARRYGAAIGVRQQSRAAGVAREQRTVRPMAWTTDWTSRAACRGTDPDALFVQGAAQNRAKTVCLGCPVRAECLADALDNRVEFGVWGGLTERERRALLRRRPNVTSWQRLLSTAMTDFERGVAERYSAVG